MAQDRNSKKNAAEIYASEVLVNNLAFYQKLAAPAPATPATTSTTPTPSTGLNLQAIPPVVWLGAGGGLLLLLLLKR